MSSTKKQSAAPADSSDEHAADMVAAKQALARVAAEREARAEALRNVSSGGKGGSKVSGRGRQRAAGTGTSVNKSGDR